MAKYICGPSVLRLDGKVDTPIQPGDAFDTEFSEDQEALLLASGAITKAEAPAASTAAPFTRSPVPAGPTDGAGHKE